MAVGVLRQLVLLHAAVQVLEDGLLFRVEIAPIPVNDPNAAGRRTDAHVNAVIRSIVPLARQYKELVRVKVEEDVDQVLVAPRQLHFVLFVKRHYLFLPLKLAQPSEIHHHHARVYAQGTVEGVSREAIVPADVLVLVLRYQGRYLRGIKELELVPNVRNRRDE